MSEVRIAHGEGWSVEFEDYSIPVDNEGAARRIKAVIEVAYQSGFDDGWIEGSAKGQNEARAKMRAALGMPDYDPPLPTP